MNASGQPYLLQTAPSASFLPSFLPSFLVARSVSARHHPHPLSPFDKPFQPLTNQSKASYTVVPYSYRCICYHFRLPPFSPLLPQPNNKPPPTLILSSHDLLRQHHYLPIPPTLEPHLRALRCCSVALRSALCCFVLRCVGLNTSDQHLYLFLYLYLCPKPKPRHRHRPMNREYRSAALRPGTYVCIVWIRVMQADKENAASRQTLVCVVGWDPRMDTMITSIDGHE